MSGVAVPASDSGYSRRVERGGPATTVGAVAVLLAVAVAARLELTPQLHAAVELSPELLAAPVALLAVRFGRHRALVAAMVIVALARLGGPTTPLAVGGVMLLAALLAVPELRVGHPAAILHLLLAGAALPLLAGYWSQLAALGWPARWMTEPWPAVTVSVCAVAAGAGLWWRRSPLDVAVPWLLLAVVVSRWAPGRLAVSPELVLGGAQALLLVTLAETGHLLATTDRLTALANRRAFEDRIGRLRGRFTIALADVDHFKRFNDRWGHAAGDQALRMVATELAAVADRGRAYRWGGEEFAIVFAGREARDVSDSLDAVRAAIAERGFVVRAAARPRRKPRRTSSSAGPTVHVTVSIGAASPTALRASVDDVLRAADRALYRAKRAGRNRVVVA